MRTKTRRAVRFSGRPRGIAAIEASRREIEPRYGVQLQARVGVHTGEVVVGEMAGGGAGAVGPTPNIAARLQDLAGPNTIVVSGATRQLVTGYFNLEDLGPHQLKGVTGNTPLFRVLGATGATSRPEAFHMQWPMVGRQTQQRLLEQAWRQATESQEVTPLLITAEPGMGKSRLVRFLRAHAERQGGECLEGVCSSYHIDSPFYSIAQMLEKLTGAFASDSPEVRLHKLEERLTLDEMPTESTPVLATLLSIPLSDKYPPLLIRLKPSERPPSRRSSSGSTTCGCTRPSCSWSRTSTGPTTRPSSCSHCCARSRSRAC